MKFWAFVGVLAASALACASAGDAKTKPHGACIPVAASPAWGMFGPDRNAVPLATRRALYRQLGLGWARVNTSIPVGAHQGLTDVDDIGPYHADNLKIFLTINAPALRRGGGRQEDFDAFAAGLRTTIATYHPAMIAVENEADDAAYTTSPSDYLREVKVACAVAHAASVRCTDSGFTGKMLIALVVNYYLVHGDQARAEHYARYLRLWYPMHFQLDPTGPTLVRMIQGLGVARASAILAGLRAAGADRVDMHWYVRPSNGFSPQEQEDLLRQAIHVLVATSGLPVVAGEVGVDKPHGDDATADPQPFLAMMGVMANMGVGPIIVWNPGSGLFKANLNARSLVDASGGLLPLGRAYGQLTRTHRYSDGMAVGCR